MKRILISFSILIFGISTYAQEVDLGVKFGINSIRLSEAGDSNISSYSAKSLLNKASNGFNIGLFGRAGLGKFYLQPELLYSINKGQATFDTSDDSTTPDGVKEATQKLNIKKIEIPLLFGMKVLNLKLSSLRVFTGPAMSFILKSSSVDFTKLEESVANVLEKSENFKSNTWDWQLGVAFDLAMFTLDARYSYGITKLFDGEVSDIKLQNKGDFINVSLGFRFL